jgi:uracil-DNA glycosylase
LSSMSLEEQKDALEAIAAEIVVCTKCPLHKGRTNAVPGAGPSNAEIMFIGEGPGQQEDKQGLPFVGPSGRLLEELLKTIGMDRNQVFITNVVKCRPPENRDPLPNEIETCTSNYLFRQIELINPKLIATLGRYSMGLFFPKAKITQIHGQPKRENGRVYLPLFHPAAVLRNMETLKPQAVADFKKIPALLAEIRKEASKGNTNNPNSNPSPSKPPTQLNLF